MSRDRHVQPIALSDGRIRAVIENIQPAVDGGRFAVKRVVGDEFLVEADCFADGRGTDAGEPERNEIDAEDECILDAAGGVQFTHP